MKKTPEIYTLNLSLDDFNNLKLCVRTRIEYIEKQLSECSSLMAEFPEHDMTDQVNYWESELVTTKTLLTTIKGGVSRG